MYTPTILVTEGKREENPPLPEKSESAGKRRKRYVDSPTGKSKTCITHSPGYYSEECKVLGNFWNKFANSRPTKERRSNPTPRKKLTNR